MWIEQGRLRKCLKEATRYKESGKTQKVKRRKQMRNKTEKLTFVIQGAKAFRVTDFLRVF
jgi:hypothetical protein